MAGAGYKLFSTGDVLSASDVNTYLQQQTVMVFASAAARTTALASVLAEGMVTYLKDTDVVEIYTGAAWVSLDDPNAIQNSIVTAKGDIIGASAASTPTKLAVGTTGQILTVDSTTATGLKWATASGGFPAWTSYTPTVTSTSGSITSYTAIGWYSQSGKTVVYAGKATITLAGTAAGSMIFTVPITAATHSGIYWDGTAVEHTVTGFGGWATLASAGTNILVRKYDFTTFIANGAEVSFTITYEVA